MEKRTSAAARLAAAIALLVAVLVVVVVVSAAMSGDDSSSEGRSNKPQAQQEKKLTMTVALLAGAALLGGWWALSRNRSNGVASAYDQAKYKTKMDLAKQSVKSAVGRPLANGPVESLSNSLKKNIHNVKTAAENITA